MLCAELFNPSSTCTCRALTGAAKGKLLNQKYSTRCLDWAQSLLALPTLSMSCAVLVMLSLQPQDQLELGTQPG